MPYHCAHATHAHGVVPTTCFVLAWVLFGAGVSLTAASQARYDPEGTWVLLMEVETWSTWRAAVTHYVFLRVLSIQAQKRGGHRLLVATH